MEAKGFVEYSGEVGDFSDFAHGRGLVFVWECESERFLKFRERGWVGKELVS